VGDGQTIYLDVSGKLEVFAVARRASRVELWLRFPDAKVRTRTAQGSESIDELARELARPFFATLDTGV
jgi:hypothetical protein